MLPTARFNKIGALFMTLPRTIITASRRESCVKFPFLYTPFSKYHILLE